MNNEEKSILTAYLLSEHDVNDTGNSLFVNLPTTKDNISESNLAAFGQILENMGIHRIKMLARETPIGTSSIQSKMLQFDGEEAHLLRDIRRVLAAETLAAQTWDNTRNPAAISLDLGQVPSPEHGRIMASLAVLGVGTKESLRTEHKLMDSGYTLIKGTGGSSILEITGTERYHLESVMQRHRQHSTQQIDAPAEESLSFSRFFASAAAAIGLKKLSLRLSGQKGEDSTPSGDKPSPL